MLFFLFHRKLHYLYCIGLFTFRVNFCNCRYTEAFLARDQRSKVKVRSWISTGSTAGAMFCFHCPPPIHPTPRLAVDFPLCPSPCQYPHLLVTYLLTYLSFLEWLGSRVVSVLDSGAQGPGFKSQLWRCRVAVLGKLFTPIVPLFIKQ